MGFFVSDDPRRAATTSPSSYSSGYLPLASYQLFAADDLLREVVMEQMLAGVASRRHARAAEPVGAQVAEAAKATSKSAISRRFVRETEPPLAELMTRELTGQGMAQKRWPPRCGRRLGRRVGRMRRRG
jgi:hypothetical protein